MKLNFLVIYFLSFLFGSLTISQNQKNKNPVFSIGEVITVSNKIEFSVEKAMVWTPNNEFIKPEDGNFFLTFLIYIKNIGNGSEDYNLLYCSLKDSEGYTFSPTGGGPNPVLSAGDLSSGEKVRGYVTFEVPRSAKGGYFIYLLSLWGKDKIVVKL